MIAVGFRAQAEAMRADLVACRRDLHKQPGISFDKEVLPFAVALMSAAIADSVMDHGG